MIEYNEEDQAEISGDTSLGVKVIGVGGSGANVLDRMALEGSDEAELLTLNTDVRALSTSVSSEKIQLGSTLLKGMGTGGDPELGKQAALEAVDEIRAAVKDSRMVFVCVGLGGGTGSGAAPEVCRIAKEEGVFLVVFATLPFTFEGERRMVQATSALDLIGKYANAVVTFDNDRMGELIVPKDGVTQAFAAADKIISQAIRATMNVVFRPGIIRIGMDDLLSALHSKKSRCLFGYGQAKGENRSLEAVDHALKCPLLDRGRLIENARSVLVQVSGGDTMTLFEVQLVMEEISKHIGPDTQVLFGTGTDPRLGNSLAVTVISSIGGDEEEVEVDVEEEQEELVQAASSPADPVPASPLAAAVSAAESGQLVQPGFSVPPASSSQPVYEPITPGPAPVAPIQPASGEASGPGKLDDERSAVSEPVAPASDSGPGDIEPVPPEAPVEAAVIEPVAPAPERETREPVEVVAPKKSVVDAPPMESVSAMSPLTGGAPLEEDDDPSLSNPIARAVQEASEVPEAAIAPQEEVQPVPPLQGSPSPEVPAADTTVEAGEPVDESSELEDPVAKREPVKMSPFVPEQGNPDEAVDLESEVAAHAPGVDRVEATTDSAQTITLSRIVSSGNTGRIQTRDPGEVPAAGPVTPNLPPTQDDAVPPAIPALGQSKEAKQQQELLQLEPVTSGKGRFAKTDPTIVDGEDLDVPTFLRKKKS